MFHRASGATHLFGLTASAVLDALLAGLTREQEIARHAARLLEVAEDNRFQASVNECVHEIRLVLEG